ncbi:ribonuclease III [Mobilicoccus massiliensis]|uniref:ribonuclease III n=1 Tax=Mobilicoccus massiliensis TaxID=1522310 RepID=UPI00069352F0|nr:ribonuclease III [Mobilicoccus massiliensis]
MGVKTGAKAGHKAVRPLADLAADIEGIIGVRLDEALLRHALTHRSYAYENGGVPNNERLEFLGDSVLGLVVTESLYADHPDMAEGQLAKLRAAVVNMRALAEVARTLDVGDYLLLGRGEETTGGRDKASILADTMEALFGTVYLAEGLDKARVFVHHLIDPLLASSTRLGAGLDWKTSLQELAASGSHGIPEYRVTEEGPDHEKVFTARAVVGEEELGRGVGRSKKEAEQQAAHTAWTELTRRAAAVLQTEVAPEDDSDS